MFNVIVDNSKSNIGSRAEFASTIRDLALAQIPQIAVRQAYSEVEPENSGLRPAEIKGKTKAEVAEVLWARIERIAHHTSNLGKADWISALMGRASEIEGQLQADWTESWKSDADGKLLLEEILQKYNINVDRLAIKRKIIKAMKAERTENWQNVRALISAELG